MTDEPRPALRAKSKPATPPATLVLTGMVLVGMVLAIFLIGISIGLNIR